MTFQEIILGLQDYWAKQGCIIYQPCDIEVGAGTFNPATFMRVLGPEPWRVAYVEPSRRPTDGRYGDNPWRTGHYYQYQVILKPSPPNIQELYLKSLEHLGVDLRKHDIRFVEDDWESPTLGAAGLGWEIWLDGSEITQYTYFQQMGSIDLDPISVEITYGLERITLDSQDIDSFFDIVWTPGITYGDVHHQSEVEYSRYYLDEANTSMLFMLFDTYEKEALDCLEKGLILPAVDYVLKCSHTFNVLDARKSISVTERVSYIARVRNLARKCAQGYCEQRENMGYPLLKDKASIQSVSQAACLSVSRDAQPAGSSADFLLEVGTEEIPASYILPALDQMKEQISRLFKENRINFESIITLGTPRRLVLSVTGVSLHQSEQIVEVMGPSKKAAFDENGEPTKAAEGFARKYGVSADSLKVKATERGEYVYLLQQESGRPTHEFLSERLPDLISSLSFPKSMHFNRSEDGKLQFARPVRWIVALLGEEVIPFNVGRINSDRFTYGHRLLSEGPIKIDNASLSLLQNVLKQAGVIVAHEERKKLIRDQVSEILESEKCPIYIDEELLDTVTFLVETPRPVVGTFSEDYLKLPVEVLETAMKKHQRYFTFHTGVASGTPLLPKFITITNGVGDENIIRHGNERVLKARLADSNFFYNEDQKVRLADKVENLKHVVFQVELGSLYEKTQRLMALTLFICGKIGLDQNICCNALRAAELCKVDLITQMVIEFPSLQGIMGGYYAVNTGENQEVAEAIRYHYYPTSPEGDLPKNIAGCIVSIADKLDTISGYFGIGNIPSGSQDPYALRRQASGIIRILTAFDLHLNLEELVEKSVSLYNRFTSQTTESVLRFLEGRVSSLLSDRGFVYDVVDSVISAGSNDVPDALKRAEAVSEFRKRPDFELIYNAFNRVIRILPKELQSALKDDKSGIIKVEESLLDDPAEKVLYESSLRMEREIRPSLANRDYGKSLDQLAGLRLEIDSFFDAVMVMVDSVELRNNRLALLQRLARMFYLVADFSKLVE